MCDDITGTDIPWGVELLKTEISKVAPSPLAAPHNFSQIAGPGHIIACNRPFEYNTLPHALRHEPFGNIKDRCKAVPSERALAFS